MHGIRVRFDRFFRVSKIFAVRLEFSITHVKSTHKYYARTVDDGFGPSSPDRETNYKIIQYDEKKKKNRSPVLFAKVLSEKSCFILSAA